MKVLWACNTVFPFPAKQIGVRGTQFGGWMTSLHARLIEEPEIEVAVASVYDGKTLREFSDGRTTYFMVPSRGVDDTVDVQYWDEVVARFRPDVIHAHGTERSYALTLIECRPVPAVVSLQGLMGPNSAAFLAGLQRADLRRHRTLRSTLLRDSVELTQTRFARAQISEIRLMRAAAAVIGRTDFDRAYAQSVAPGTRYHHADELLRAQFFGPRWAPDGEHENTIFVSQGSYPLKGIHFAIRALARIRHDLGDVRLVVAGSPPFREDSVVGCLKRSDYGSYVRALLRREGVKDAVEFTGVLSPDQVIDRMLSARVSLTPSAIENSSNALGEAMLLGMPCVAAATGGTPTILDHGRLGVLYQFDDPDALAEAVHRVYARPEGAQLGEAAHVEAAKRHDPDRVVATQIRIYEDSCRTS